MFIVDFWKDPQDSIHSFKLWSVLIIDIGSPFPSGNLPDRYLRQILLAVTITLVPSVPKISSGWLVSGRLAIIFGIRPSQSIL